MITIDSAPPDVALTGNPVRFGLISDNFLVSAGAKATFYITFGIQGDQGHTLTIEWGTHSQLWTCVTIVPEDEDFHLPDAIAYPDLAEWVAAAAQQFRLNYDLSRDFLITNDETTIYFDAREYGDEYVVTWDNYWAIPAPTATTGGTEPVYRDFFKILVQLLLWNGIEYENIGEDVLPVDENGLALFDLHNLFADRVDSFFTFPEASDNLCIVQTNACLPYRLRFAEMYGYGSELTISKLIETEDTYYILAAGVSKLQEAMYNSAGMSWYEKWTYNLWFLTWQPKTKYIDRYQIEKLYYFNNTDEESGIGLWYEVNYNDGTSQLSPAPTSPVVVPAKAKTVYEFIVTLNAVMPPGYDEDNIDYIRVWVMNASNERISEIRTYYMDYSPHENIRYFLFKNSMGGYDTLRCTGDQQDSIRWERSTITKPLPAGYTELLPEVANHQSVETRTYQANTGWKTRDDIAWIRDFLLSPEIYQVMGDGLKLVPVVITSSDVVQCKDREDLFSIDFEYQRSYRSQHYTKELVYADFDTDYVDDFANE